MKYKVAITIVNYNTKDLLMYCLKKIYQADIQVPFRVIVLDNASRDQADVYEEVKSLFPEAKILLSPTNTGYTKGLNQCIQEAHNAQYIYNLNTDAFIESGVVEKLSGYLDDHTDIGLIGPQLLNFDGSIQESSFCFMTPQIALYRRTILGLFPFAQKELDRFLMRDWDRKSIKEVDWILGAAFMFRQDIAEKIGFLDEDMFLYLSDTYFAWQIWSLNYKVVYYPKVKMYHYHRKSSHNTLFLQTIFNKAYWIHIADGIQYFAKTWRKSSPHIE